jgi:rhodanese-related sulfurtransferase/uncharacterized membrane protein YphA (DoxX/SURF4 family)
MFFSIVRILVGLFFLFSGAVKLVDLQSFRDAVVMFDILPKQFINIATVTIPSAELVCGLALLLNSFKRAALSILTFLVVVFITAIAVNLLKGRTFECGCLGFLKITDNISWYSVLFDGGILIVIVLLFIREPSKISYFEQIKVIALASLFLSLTVNIHFRNENLPYALNARKIQEIDWSQAIKMIKEEKAILFDGRNITKYNRLRVKNALPLPLDEFDTYYKNYQSAFGGDKDRKLIVYCDTEVCGTARRLAYKLVFKGHKNTYVVKGGIESLLQSDLVKKKTN